MRAALLLVPALLACHSEGTLLLPTPDITLRVDTPTYGEFLGSDPAIVTGQVFPADAHVTIEGRQVQVDASGMFSARVMPDDAYRIIDVVATLRDAKERVRVPVFRGHDPLDTWPGGMTMRLTPGGMTKLGEGLGATIDATGWDQQLLAAIPSIQTQNFSLTPVAVEHDPTIVALTPATDGVDAAVTFRNIALKLRADVPVGNFTIPVPVTVGYQRAAVGLRATPLVDGDGFLSLAMSTGDITLDTPTVTVFGIDSGIVELILSVIGSVIEPVGETLIDAALGGVGDIQLGGPYVFQSDLLGTSIEVRLSDVYGDPDGVGAGLGVGLDEPALVGNLPIPAPIDPRPAVHAGLGLHEGLMQLVVTGDAMDVLTQDISLPGAFGEIIGTAVRNLPGGDEAPEGDGWCMSLDPGTARVARLQTGIAPLGVLYVPDLVVDVGVLDGSTCETWLKTSLALEVNFNVHDGTRLDMSLAVPEGAVLEYGTTEDYDEAEVVAGLGAFLQTAVSLFGGQLSFDLADLMGGLGGQTGDPTLDALLGNLQPEIVDSQPMLDDAGEPIEGLYGVSLRLWQ